jgi:hypothetical protein
VKPIRDWADPPAESARCCAVVGYGCIRVTADQLACLRQNPGPKPGPPISPTFLKHADEQTVVSVAALFQAIERHGLADTCFTDWAVLSAPRYLGRITTSQAILRFAAEGAWGISPHLIPHRTLHAISGTISQALQIHGPNLGVGGGPEAALEVMRVAAAFLADPDLPGIWVVMSGWNPEPNPHSLPTAQAASSPSTNGYHLVAQCQAVALALSARPHAGHELSLEFQLTSHGSNGHLPKQPLTPFCLESLLGALDSTSPRTHHWALGGIGSVELKHVRTAAEINP